MPISEADTALQIADSFAEMDADSDTEPDDMALNHDTYLYGPIEPQQDESE